jgi:hypothetical protein
MTSVEAVHLDRDVHFLRAAGRPVDRGDRDSVPIGRDLALVTGQAPG